MSTNILHRMKKGVIEEGGAIVISLILVVLAIAVFLLVIIPFLTKLTVK